VTFTVGRPLRGDDGRMGSRGRGAVRDPTALLARAGVRGDPDRDQHFLVDERVLSRLVEYAEPFDRSRVLEVGAGTGVLTDRLLDVADHVVAVERDHDLVAFLRREFAAELGEGRLDLLEADATTVELPSFSACVSNLPYGVSSPVLFRLLPRKRPLLVMVQREFGERMAAEPGTDAYGRLSVTTQHYAAVEVLEVVPPSAFDPAPAVESAVVRTTPREPDYVVEDESVFLDLVRAVFTQRRKTLRNAIRNTTHISGIADPVAVLEGLPEERLRRRPGELPPAAFAEIARLASERGGAGGTDGVDEDGDVSGPGGVE